VRLARLDLSSVATDEQMRERPRAQNFLDGGNAASPAQTCVDDHQVRPVTGGGADRLGLRGCRRANIVPHANEQLGEQHGNQGVILDDEHAERFHQLLDAHP
jgi:hypothetical protein